MPVAYNCEGRERLKPAFRTSHPDTGARFALWMKLGLNLRDRAIFVSQHEGRPSGFVIALSDCAGEAPGAPTQRTIGT